MDGEEVGFLDGVRVDPLAGLNVRQGGKPVAVTGGDLELQVLRGFFHGGCQFGLDAAAAAGEERLGAGDQLCVVLRTDFTGARCRAATPRSL